MSKNGFKLSYVIIPLLVAGCAGTPPTGPVADGEPAHAPTTWKPGNYVINLYDAFGPKKDGLTHDFGFSAIVRYNNRTILFDSGSNADLLRSNAAALGINLRDIDFAVASHSHFDHINGFDYLIEVNPDVKIYFPKDLFWGANLDFDVTGPEPEVAESLPVEQRYFDGTKTRFPFNQTGRFWNANVEFIDQNTEIEPGVTLIVTRSPYMGYFTRYPSLGDNEGQQESTDDAVKTMGLLELSLNLATDEGDVIMVGCSHSTVEAIVRETKQHLARDIGLVFGGYHLLPYKSAEVRGIATRMKDELRVTEVAPAHCTGHVGFAVFREVYDTRFHMAGLGTTTPFPAPH